MAMRVNFALHRAKRITAVFHGGDERGTVALPPGWEELVPRDLITNDAAFARWIAGDLHARLVGLTPPGFKAKRGLRTR